MTADHQMRAKASRAAVSPLNTRNGLLRAIPPCEAERLLPFFQPAEIKIRQVLHHPKATMEQVYFIERGLVSVSARSARDKWVEAWLTGSEGMTGIPVILGDRQPPLRRVVQVGGSALRISRSDLHEAIEHCAIFRELLFRYVEVVLFQTSQSSACNATHDLKQRLSRWLLMARDGLADNFIPLTHQVLARLLGTRRPSVTQCLGHLEHENAVRNTRGRIEIIDSDKLESLSCDCHRLIRRQYDRLLGVRR